VNALAASGTDLYAGGSFTTAGGVSANYIAKWNGSTWSALGSGTNSYVRALAFLSSGEVFAGGDFTIAGDKVSAYVARTRVPTPQTLTLSAITSPTYGHAPLTVSATASSGLPATYSVVSGPGTMAGNTLTITGVGSIVVAANQAGDATYAAAAQVTQSVTVQPAPLTVTASAASRVFGAANPTFTGTITGLVNADAITATYASSANATTPAGTYGPSTAEAITPTLVDPGSRLGNYTVTSTKGTLNITGSTVQTVSFVDPGTQVYGAAPIALNATSSSGLPVTFSVVSGPASVSGNLLSITGAGVVVVKANQSGDLTYSEASMNRSITVQPAPLTVTANAASRQVATANPAFTGTITGLVNADPITVTYASSAGDATPVGIYGPTAADAIVPTLVDPNNRLGNYAVTSTKGTLTITLNAPPVSNDGGGSGGGGCGIGGGMALVMVTWSALLMWRRRMSMDR